MRATAVRPMIVASSTTRPRLPIGASIPRTARRAAMIFRSPYPDSTIPDLPLTQFVLQHAARLTDKPALIDGPSGRTLTYGQLAESVHRVVFGLTKRGFRKGDVFAAVCPNILEFPIAFYAVASLGGTTTMANPLLTTEELARQLADADPKFVLTVPERLDVVREATAGTHVEEIFVAGEADGATPFAALFDDVRSKAAAPIDPAADVVALPYSSGTTGRQKA
jgi:acyl-coenzyme A synthetase/AMP-(fatty) acid ligase